MDCADLGADRESCQALALALAAMSCSRLLFLGAGATPEDGRGAWITMPAMSSLPDRAPDRARDPPPMLGEGRAEEPPMPRKGPGEEPPMFREGSRSERPPRAGGKYLSIIKERERSTDRTSSSWGF